MPFAASERLSLTTMHQPIDRMATQCIDCLIARIQDPEPADFLDVPRRSRGSAPLLPART